MQPTRDHSAAFSRAPAAQLVDDARAPADGAALGGRHPSGDGDELLFEQAKQAVETFRPLEGREAFVLLWAARTEPINARDACPPPRLLSSLVVRMSASPIAFEPGGTAFYVARREEGQRRETHMQPNAMQISFQSFTNAELYWSERRDEQGRRFGVAARAMSRRVRSSTAEGAVRTTVVHGYAGRYLSLIRETGGAYEVSGKYAHLDGGHMLVQAWPVGVPAAFNKKRRRPYDEQMQGILSGGGLLSCRRRRRPWRWRLRRARRRRRRRP